MFETLKNLLVEELQLNADDIKPESELANDLGINSIELADLIMLCEDKFGVTLRTRISISSSPLRMLSATSRKKRISKDRSVPFRRNASLL